MPGQPQQLTLAFPSVPGLARPGLASPGIPGPLPAAVTGGPAVQRAQRTRAVTGPRSAPAGGTAGPGRRAQPLTGGAATPRRSAARGLWRVAYGAVPAVAAPAQRQQQPVSRRVPVRGQWHGISGAVPAVAGQPAAPPKQQSQMPRRSPVRGQWHRVLGTAPAAAAAVVPVLRQQPQAPRRVPARGQWRAACGTAPAGAAPAVPAPARRPVIFRRTPALVMWRGTAAATANAAAAGAPVIFSVRAARRLWSVTTGRNSNGGGMFLTQEAVSTEPIQALIGAMRGGAAYSPSADPVSFAFVAMPSYGVPVPPAASSGAWLAASWEVDAGPQYWASVMVGPQGGAVSFPAGTAWQSFIKIVDAASGATPVLQGPLVSFS